MFDPGDLMWPLLTVIVFAAVGGWWFGLHRRSQEEAIAGVKILATMKWRECLGLLLLALRDEGFAEIGQQGASGESASEFLLNRDGKRYLLTYKHGTAYRIGESSIREMSSSLNLMGVDRGILATLGQAEQLAHTMSQRADMRLIDGVSLWHLIRPHVDSNTLANVTDVARDKTRRQLWLSGLGSVIAGLLVFAVLPSNPEQPSFEARPSAVTPVVLAPADTAPTTPAPPAAVDTAPVVAPSPTPAAPTTPATQPTPAVNAYSDTEQRAEIVKLLKTVSGVDRANWSSQSTLAVRLATADTDLDSILSQVCTTLTPFGELRYSRLQFEMPENSGIPVRWRRCN